MNRKLKLDADDLQVESFASHEEPEEKGTVEGQELTQLCTGYTAICYGCKYPTRAEDCCGPTVTFEDRWCNDLFYPSELCTATTAT